MFITILFVSLQEFVFAGLDYRPIFNRTHKHIHNPQSKRHAPLWQVAMDMLKRLRDWREIVQQLLAHGQLHRALQLLRQRPDLLKDPSGALNLDLVTDLFTASVDRAQRDRSTAIFSMLYSFFLAVDPSLVARSPAPSPTHLGSSAESILARQVAFPQEVIENAVRAELALAIGRGARSSGADSQEVELERRVNELRMALGFRRWGEPAEDEATGEEAKEEEHEHAVTQVTEL